MLGHFQCLCSLVFSISVLSFPVFTRPFPVSVLGHFQFLCSVIFWAPLQPFPDSLFGHLQFPYSVISVFPALIIQSVLYAMCCLYSRPYKVCVLDHFHSIFSVIWCLSFRPSGVCILGQQRSKQDTGVVPGNRGTII